MAKMLDSLTAHEIECALIAAAIRNPSVFAIDLDAADFSHEGLQSFWRTGQALVVGDRADEKPLFQAALRQLRQENVRLGIEVERLGNLMPDPEECAALVRDLAWRRRAAAELEAVERIIHTGTSRWTADLAAAAGRLQKLALAPQPGRPPTGTGWSAADLLVAEFPQPEWAVPGLIPVGLSFLGGRPKVGKSYLVLQIAIAKGTGGQVLGRQVEQGPALYLALEDNGRRLRERATRQQMPANALVRFETTWPGLTTGGLGLLEQTIDAEGYRLVVIDTLGRACRRADMDDYGGMTELLGALQSMALARDTAILVVDHYRKGVPGVADDPVDAIMGSTGKVGTADGVLGLTKQQGRPGAYLRVKGRELEEVELVLTWDRVRCCWECAGTTEEVELSGRRGQVLEILRDAYPQAMLAGEIAKAAELQRENVISLLNDLVREGHATKEPKQGRDQPYRAARGTTAGIRSRIRISAGPAGQRCV